MRFTYYVAFGILATAGVAGAVIAVVGPAPRGANTPAPPQAALAASAPAPLTDLGPKVRLVKGGWTGNAPTARVDQPSPDPAASGDGTTGAAGQQPAASLAVANPPAAVQPPASPPGAGQPILLQPAAKVDAAPTAPATPVALTTPRDDPSAAGGKLAVDINTASLEELNAIPGGGLIGRAIMRGRPYGSVDDLQAKRILTRDTLERIRPYVAAQ